MTVSVVLIDRRSSAQRARSPLARTAVLVATAVVPMLVGIAVVYALIPFNPPDLGWGHVAAHWIPAGVVIAILVGGLGVWAPPSGRLATLARLTVVAGLTFLAVGQSGKGSQGSRGTTTTSCTRCRWWSRGSGQCPPYWRALA